MLSNTTMLLLQLCEVTNYIIITLRALFLFQS
jgi:hypothetical protein